MPYEFRHLVGQDGETWNVPRKFLKDALELEIDKVVGNTVLNDHYHLWYIAKSYSDCYGNSNELPFGKKHSDEYARRSIWYFEKFFEVSHNWFGEGQPSREDEMGYYGLIMMGHAYNFMGDIENSEKCFRDAGLFCKGRNEHLMYLSLYLEKQGRYEEILPIISEMVKTSNPFPNKTFLIEDRCYLDSSNFLNEYLEMIKRKVNEPVMDLTSVNFDFE
jgi:tetratricopeptide (TPR) repeat protein